MDDPGESEQPRRLRFDRQSLARKAESTGSALSSLALVCEITGRALRAISRELARPVNHHRNNHRR